MTDQPFTRTDIDNLARRLGDIHPPLTPEERELLLGIFAAASQNVVRIPRKPGGDLMEQLLNAFIPENGDQFILVEPMRIDPGRPHHHRPDPGD